jgi:hypothetical protein
MKTNHESETNQHITSIASAVAFQYPNEILRLCQFNGLTTNNE